MSEETVTIAYDTTLWQPGCALLQAAYGATISTHELSKFPASEWLLSPTPGLKLRVVTMTQLRKLQEVAEKMEAAREEDRAMESDQTRRTS